MLVGVVGDFFLERGLPTETGQETSNAKQHFNHCLLCFKLGCLFL